MACLILSPCPFRAYHVHGKRVLAVKVRTPSTLKLQLKQQQNVLVLCLWKVTHFLPNVALQVIPLDITVELQKQIMSELEILYKVGFD